MGNQTSFCFFIGSKNSVIKLIDAQGNLQFLEPMTTLTAVELMLENTGFAVASLEILLQTRRVEAMRANEALSAGQTYLLVPLGKVNSRISDAQMEVLDRRFSACFGGGKRGSPMKAKRGSRSAGSRVSPTSTIDGAGAAEGDKLEEIWLSSKVDESGAGVLPIRGRWSPSLNPIFED